MSEISDNGGREALYLEMDGQLTAGERERLARWLEAGPEARREREEAARLGGLLASDRDLPPRDFTARVMATLPAAGWESRHPRSWTVALGLLAACLAAALVLAGRVGGGAPAASAVGGAAAAIGALLAASLATGSDLLGASWQGLGVALAALLGTSKLNWVAFGVLVVGVDLLLLRLLRHRPAAQRLRQR